LISTDTYALNSSWLQIVVYALSLQKSSKRKLNQPSLIMSWKIWIMIGDVDVVFSSEHSKRRQKSQLKNYAYFYYQITLKEKIDLMIVNMSFTQKKIYMSLIPINISTFHFSSSKIYLYLLISIKFSITTFGLYFKSSFVVNFNEMCRMFKKISPKKI